jgi:hypothetical protein
LAGPSEQLVTAAALYWVTAAVVAQMKFAANLQRCAHYSAPIAEVHQTYKAAKKLLKAEEIEQLSAMLESKAAEWNEYYLDTEENLVIECSELQTTCKEWDSNVSKAKRESQLTLVKSLVDYHGRWALSAPVFRRTGN